MVVYYQGFKLRRFNKSVILSRKEVIKLISLCCNDALGNYTLGDEFLNSWEKVEEMISNE